VKFPYIHEGQAMRQIWFNDPKTRDKILSYLKTAIQTEQNEKALEGIITTAQDLLKKKLRLKESQSGDVTGDIILAIIKTETALENPKNGCMVFIPNFLLRWND
jgi:hypothetical protein